MPINVKSSDFTKYISELTRNFTGREWVFKALDDWLKSKESKFFIIIGEPGSGKSAIAGRLNQFSSSKVIPPKDFVYIKGGFTNAVHFCSSSKDKSWLNPLVFVKNLALQLGECFPEYLKALIENSVDRQFQFNLDLNVQTADNVIGIILQNIEVRGISSEDAFIRLVKEPLEVLHDKDPEQQVIILVDALDEAILSKVKPNIAELLVEASNLPPNVRLILTLSPETEILRSLRRYEPKPKEISLTSGEGLVKSVQQDIRKYVLQVLTVNPSLTDKFASNLSKDAFLSAVQEKSDGNFLYVNHLIQMLMEQDEEINQESLIKLPIGLSQIYIELLKRVTGNDRRIWEDEYMSILGILAVAQEAFTEDLISRLLGTENSKVRRILVSVRQLLDTDELIPASQRTYAIYHRSFSEFLLDSDKSEEYWCGEAERYHLTISNYFIQEYGDDWLSCKDKYALQYLPTHLVEAGKRENLRHLLFDFEWIQAKLESTDVNSIIMDYNFFLEDTALQQIAGAIRLSAHVLAYDKRQLQSQLYGRLMLNKLPDIKKLLGDIILGRGDIWLKPSIPTLFQPVGPLIQTLTGHKETINSVAVSSNEKYVISASDDKTLRIWDIESRLSIGVLNGHTGPVASVLSIPGSNRVISISEDDHTMRIWDLDSKSELFPPIEASLMAIAISPNGKYAYTLSRRSEFINIWDLTNRKLFKVFKGHSTMMGKNIVVSPDGKKLIASTWQDYKLKVWRLDDFELLCTFDKHKGYIASFFITDDNKYVISASNHGYYGWRRTIKKWELETAKEILSIEYTQQETGIAKDEKNEAYAIKSIAPLPNDDNSVISASNSGPLQIWDLQGKSDLLTLKGHEQSVYDVKVIRNRNLAISCSQDKTLKIWELSRVKEVQSYIQHKVGITSILLPSDSRLAVTFSWDGDMRVWDLEKIEEQKSLSVYKGLLKCISLFPDGQRGIAALSDKSLRIWDIYSGKELRRIKLNTYAPPDFKSIKISPDSNYAIATFDEEGVDEGGASRVSGVYKFDLNKGDSIKPQILIDDHGDYLGNRISYYGNPINFTSDGNYVIAASGYWASNLSVWSFENPSMRYDVKYPIIKGSVNSIVPVPNSNYILTSSDPNEIKIWDIHNKIVIRDISLRTDGTNAVAIAANGERAVSADKLHQINLWDFKTGDILARFSAESDITACSITPDGKTIIAGERSGRIYLLKVQEKIQK